MTPTHPTVEELRKLLADYRSAVEDVMSGWEYDSRLIDKEEAIGVRIIALATAQAEELAKVKKALTVLRTELIEQIGSTCDSCEHTDCAAIRESDSLLKQEERKA